MVKKVIKITILTLVFLLVFFHITWLNISSVRLTKWLNFQGELLLPKSMTLLVKDANPTFGGLQVKSVEIRKQVGNLELIKLSQVNLSFGLLDLLLFQEIPFQFNVYDGVGKGHLDLLSGPRLALKVDDVSVNHNPYLRKTNILKSNPLLAFDGEVDLGGTRQGKVSFQLQKITINGDSKTSGLMFSFPDTRLEKISGKVSLDGRLVKLEMDTKGDISNQLKGQVQLDWKRFKRSRLNLKLLANLKKGYKKKLNFLFQDRYFYQ